MSKKAIQEMFDHAVHIGHRTQKWNPKMKRFIHGERNGVHVLNLEKTAPLFEEGLKFLSKMTSEGKTVLFVSTKPQSIKYVRDAAKEVNMPFVVSKWIPGFLTNFQTVKQRIKYLARLKEERENGEFSKYTKKEASKLSKTIDKLEVSLGGVQNITRKPDAVFVLDSFRDELVVKECATLGIPVVSIVDTNADPDAVTYPIPGNNNALKAIKYFLAKVTETMKNSKKR